LRATRIRQTNSTKPFKWRETASTIDARASISSIQKSQAISRRTSFLAGNSGFENHRCDEIAVNPIPSPDRDGPMHAGERRSMAPEMRNARTDVFFALIITPWLQDMVPLSIRQFRIPAAARTRQFNMVQLGRA